MQSNSARATARCGAKTRSGKPCQSYAMANGRCRMHGGTAARGIASGRFTTGKYSKYLPSGLLAHYEAALHDKELLNLKSEIALVDARLVELIKQLTTGESGALWDRLVETWEAVERARDAGNLTAMRDGLNAVGDLMRQGSSEWATWDHVYPLVDQRRRLVESERKRMVEMQQMLSVEQALAMADMVIGAVRRNVHDRDVLAAIQADVQHIFGRRKSGDDLQA